jgi:hypothetical protein
MQLKRKKQTDNGRHKKGKIKDKIQKKERDS